MIKFNIIYNRKKKLKKNGTALIQIELYLKGDRVFITTNVCVEPSFWDNRNRRVSSNHPQNVIHNAIIQNKIQHLNEIQHDLILSKTNYNLTTFLTKISQKNISKLSEFIKIEIKKDNLITEKTKIDLRNTRNKLDLFNKDVKLNEIDYQFIVEFDRFLRDSGLSINTIAKQHKNLKRFLNLAIRYKLIKPENYPYSQFKVKKEKTKREVLTYNEMIKIWDLRTNLKNETLIIQMMFSFACFTGLRISDVTRLKWEYVKKTDKGYELNFKSYKTGKEVMLPLHLLFKNKNYNITNPEMVIYKLIEYGWAKREYLFPIKNEAIINKTLKGIAEEAKIGINLTFHIARHSFGTYMASKVPLPTLQELMQHSSINTTMIYVNMSEKMIKSNLENLDWES